MEIVSHLGMLSGPFAGLYIAVCSPSFLDVVVDFKGGIPPSKSITKSSLKGIYLYITH